MAVKPVRTNFAKADTSFNFGANAIDPKLNTIAPPRRKRPPKMVRNSRGKLVSNFFAASQGS